MAKEHKPRDFTQPLTLHSDASFFNLNVFAFPPLELVDSFLSDVVNWQSASVIAVLPLKATQGFKGNATLLHAYGSHFGIFERRSGQKLMPAPPMGCAMGVFRLENTSTHIHIFTTIHT